MAIILEVVKFGDLKLLQCFICFLMVINKGSRSKIFTLTVAGYTETLKLSVYFASKFSQFPYEPLKVNDSGFVENFIHHNSHFEDDEDRINICKASKGTTSVEASKLVKIWSFLDQY